MLANFSISKMVNDFDKTYRSMNEKTSIRMITIIIVNHKHGKMLRVVFV